MNDPSRMTIDAELRVVLLAANVDELGGVQRVIKDLASSLTSRGITVELVSLWELDSAVRLDGYPEFSQCSLTRARWFESLLPESVWEKIGLRATRRRRLDFLLWASAARRLRRSLTAAGTIVIAMDIVAASLVASAGIKSCIKIAQYHNSFESLAQGRDLSRLRKAVNEFDALVALTGQDADEFTRAGFPVPVVTHIPNSIAADQLPARRSRENVVLAAGRYHPQKSFDLLLRAWAQVPATARLGWQLRLMGEGPERTRLVQLAQSLFPSSKDVIVGGRGNVRRELTSASVFALSSQHEGFPMVMLEALAAGTAVIATDCAPGVREILADGAAGVLVPASDHLAYAAGLESLLVDPSFRRRLGTRGLEHVAQFSPERVTDSWIALFDVLRSRSGCTSAGER